MQSAFDDAVAHHRAGRLDEAEAIYRRILDWRPAWTFGNLGVILRVTGRLEEAEAALRTVLRHEPGNVKAQHTLGMTLLQLGRFTEGWPLFEARHKLFARPTRPLPEWQGEPLQGRRLLVLAEQGFGDQILFARFLPLVAAQAAEVRVGLSRPIRPLLAAMPVEVLQGDDWQTAEADVWCSIGSVPRWLGAGPDDAPAPYLTGRPSGSQAPALGLMLDGGPKNPNPARVPPPAVQRALRALAPAVDLAPEATGAADFAATADLIAGLERVVSVDTSVAHLAGALDRPALVLLPRPAFDWWANWSDDRTRWYPSVRTLRQRQPGDWAGVVAGLAQRLVPSAHQ